MDLIFLTQLTIIAAINIELILRVLIMLTLSANPKKYLSSSFLLRILIFSLVALNIEKIATQLEKIISEDMVDKVIIYPLWLLPSIIYGIYALLDHQLERRNQSAKGSA